MKRFNKKEHRNQTAGKIPKTAYLGQKRFTPAENKLIGLYAKTPLAKPAETSAEKDALRRYLQEARRLKKIVARQPTQYGDALRVINIRNKPDALKSLNRRLNAVSENLDERMILRGPRFRKQITPNRKPSRRNPQSITLRNRMPARSIH